MNLQKLGNIFSLLCSVVGLHYSLEVSGVSGEEGDPEVVRVEVRQDGSDEVWPELLQGGGPAQQVDWLVAVQAVGQALRRLQRRVAVRKLPALLRQQTQLLGFTL